VWGCRLGCRGAPHVGGGLPRRAPRLDVPGLLDGAAKQQQLLGQRGLAGVGVRDDGPVAAPQHLLAQARRVKSLPGPPSVSAAAACSSAKQPAKAPDRAASSERACTAGPLCACSATPLVLASGASAGLLPASVSVAAAWDVQRSRCAPGRRTRPAQRSAAAQRASHAVSQPRLCKCRRCSRSVPMLRAAAPAGSATRAREAVTSFKQAEQ